MKRIKLEENEKFVEINGELHLVEGSEIKILNMNLIYDRVRVMQLINKENEEMRNEVPN